MASRHFAAGYSSGSTFTDVETLIRNSTQDFCMAFNTGNFDQASALFAPDGVLMVPNAEPVYGLKPIERALQQYSELGVEDLRLETLRVEFSGDMAVEVGRYQTGVRTPQGALRDKGKFLATWRRMGAWRILATCWSTNLPVSEQPRVDLPGDSGADAA